MHFHQILKDQKSYKKLELEAPTEGTEIETLTDIDSEEYDYITKLDNANNKLGFLNLNKESQQYLELIDLFKKYGILKKEAGLFEEYSLEILSPKFDVMLNNINNSPGLVFLYSQLKCRRY